MEERTVLEELALLRDRGYAMDFGVEVGARLRCGACGHTHAAADVVIDSTARFEGSSDPDDEAIVLGLRCEACGDRGVFVAAYGPSATAEEAAVLTALVLPPPG